MEERPEFEQDRKYGQFRKNYGLGTIGQVTWCCNMEMLKYFVVRFVKTKNISTLQTASNLLLVF